MFQNVILSHKFLNELYMAGTAIDDSAVRYLTKHCLLLEHVDFSHCSKLTDMSLMFLSRAKCLKTLVMKANDLTGKERERHDDDYDMMFFV